LEAVYAATIWYALSPDTEATLTMRPRPASTIAGSTCCMHRNAPVRFTAMARFHASRLVPVKLAAAAWPALFTRMRGGPNVSRATPNASLTLPGSVTSHTTAAVSTSCCRATCAACASSRRWSRPMSVTVAPRRASSDTMAAPMPRPPPVTTACWPERCRVIGMQYSARGTP